jgi:site-specific recombinase XerD
MHSTAKKQYPLAILTSEEVDALMRACSEGVSTGMRNRALIIAMYDVGLRVREALSLRAANLDGTTGSVTVPGRSGKEPRTVVLGPTAFAILGQWLARREALGLGAESPLFCTLQGRPIQSPYVRALLPRLARKVGIVKRVHAYGLREAHAARLAADRVPLDLVQARLGYGSRVTTDRLIRRIIARLVALGSSAEVQAEPAVAQPATAATVGTRSS